MLLLCVLNCLYFEFVIAPLFDAKMHINILPNYSTSSNTGMCAIIWTGIIVRVFMCRREGGGLTDCDSLKAENGSYFYYITIMLWRRRNQQHFPVLLWSAFNWSFPRHRLLSSINLIIPSRAFTVSPKCATRRHGDTNQNITDVWVWMCRWR